MHTIDNNLTNTIIVDQLVNVELATAIFAIEICSNIHNPSNYNEAVYNPIHGHQ